MKLYTNGCSFTEGHSDDEPWPSLLKPHFESVVNEALCGCGLDRLLRYTLSFIDSLEPKEYDEWIFLLQPSEYQRREYITEKNYYSQIVSPVDPRKIEDWKIKTWKEDGYEELYNYKDMTPEKRIQVENYILNEVGQSLVLHQLKNLIALQGILKSKNIKYLFMGMAKDNIRPRNFFWTQNSTLASCPQINHLLSHIDDERVIDSIDCHLGGPDNSPEIYDPCFHPNATGHKIIAEHVKSEIEKRNWL